MQIALVQKRKYHKGKKENGLSHLCSTTLALELGADILTPKISPKKEYDLIINWGNSNIPWYHKYYYKCFINHPIDILKAINKSTAFYHFSINEVKTVPYTNSLESAKLWFEKYSACKVVCRTLVNSFQGKGIVISSSPEELVEVELYTLYVPKQWELRVHVVNDKAIKLQQKRRLSEDKLKERGIDKANKLIRSYNNGYIFSSKISKDLDELTIQTVTSEAIKAVNSLGLSFGAVDILVTKEKEVMVLEVNTAPGIEGSTLSAYVEAFKELIGE